MRVAGFLLVVLGFAILLFGRIPYGKTENLAEIGTLKMRVTEKKEFVIPPVIGGIAIVLGTAMLFVRRRRDGA